MLCKIASNEPSPSKTTKNAKKKSPELVHGINFQYIIQTPGLHP